MVFAPKVQTGGAIPQAPSSTTPESEVFASGLNAVGQLAESFLSSSSQQSAPSESTLHRQSREALSSAFHEAKQLEDQGFSKQAQERIRKASVKYISSWGRDDDYNSIATTWGATPTSLDFVNPQQIALQNAVEDEDFTGAFAMARASMPNASIGEVTQAAVNELQSIKATDYMITKAKANWTAEGERAYHSRIDQFVASGIGSLRQKELDGGSITPDDWTRLENTWSTVTAQLSRPPNISDQQWKSIQDRKDAVGQLITSLKNSPDRTTERIKSEMLLDYTRFVQENVSSPVARASLLDPSKIAEMHPTFFTETLTQVTSLQPVGSQDVEGIKYFTGDAEETVGEPELWPSEMTRKIDPNVNVDTLRGSFESFRIINTGNMAQSSEEQRDNIEGMAAIAARNLSMIERRVSEKSMREMFGARTMGLITEMDKVDPQRSANMRARFIEGIQAQRVKHLSYLESVVGEDSPFEVDVENETISFNLNKLDVSDTVKARIKSVADQNFGGDILAYSQTPEFYSMIANTPGPAAGQFRHMEEMRNTMGALSYIRKIFDKLALNREQNMNSGNTPSKTNTPDTTNTSETSERSPTNLLNLIGETEANGNYNAYYGNPNDSATDFTSMTVDQVREWQDRFVEQGSPSSAVGKYQIIRKTLDDLKKRMNLSGDEIFNEELQDEMATELLKKRGYDKFVEGNLSEEEFMTNLAKEWASFPVPETGASYYGDDGLNKALIDVETVRGVL